jgi:hypothetical protein
MKRWLVRLAMVIGSLLAASLVTGTVELVVLSSVVKSESEAAEARGVSNPNEGFTGSHADLLAWAITLFILVFPLALAISGLLAVTIRDKLLAKPNHGGEPNGA